MYEKLLDIYNTLSEKEKNALLIYKSRLGLAINALDNNQEKVLEIYQQYKKLLDKPVNLFIKMSVFQNISFINENEFIKSLKDIRTILEKLSTQTFLEEDVTLYRAVSIPKYAYPEFISKSNFISTTLNINKCSNFFINDKDYNHYLYQINLKKGDPVIICPYRILLDSKNDRLFLSTVDDQEEIILSKNVYAFLTRLKTETELQIGGGWDVLNILVIDGTSKNNIYSNIASKH